MLIQNDSQKVITEFIFAGFDTVQRPLAVGVSMLILYIVTVVSNIANISFIVTDKRWHQPMYIFICHLAITNIVCCTSSCPTMIGILLFGFKTISYKPCIVQMFVFHLSATMEMFALAVMAFDRLYAISNPLRYPSVMTNFRCVLIIISLWLVEVVLLSNLPASVVPLPVCHSTLKYMFCDYASILRLTCVDPEPHFNNMSILLTCIMLCTFGFICLSYLKIFTVVLKMSIKSDKKKAIHTCLSHLIVIVCFYVPTFIQAVLTRIGVVLTVEERNGLKVGSIIGPALVNPFIYCFRTEEIRKKIFKILFNN